MSLVVTCPSCGTVFSMVREQLEASEGKVRCGHCMDVFDAKAQLVQMDDLDREYLSDIREPDTNQLPQSETTPTDLSFVQQAQKAQFWSRPLVRVVLTLLALFLIVLLCAQLLRSERERLVRMLPSIAPIIENLCGVWPCTAKARYQIEAWVIENSHFQKEGMTAFRLTVTLKNTSRVMLVVPQVELQLLDSSEALLVRYAISPSTDAPSSLPASTEHVYDWIISPKISANTSVKLSPKDITGYRLALFYP